VRNPGPSTQYGFWQNKFSDVAIIFEGFTNFTGVRDAAFEKFGRGHQPNRYIQKVFWLNDPAATIMVEYSEASRRGILHMLSKQITTERKRFDENKAKRGAESGF
jgi:hypothetical protein